MIKKILLGLGVALLLFVGFVATRSGTFHYQRSGLINATPDRIFPYLSDFRLGREWSPFDQDPKTKRVYSGPASGMGSVMTFEGGPEGSGRLEILKVSAPTLVEVQLEMMTPFYAKNLVRYQLATEGKATRFTWSMSGDGGFFSKLMGLLIDCDKMMGTEFDKGIQTLKHVIESKNH